MQQRLNYFSATAQQDPVQHDHNIMISTHAVSACLKPLKSSSSAVFAFRDLLNIAEGRDVF
jgi:hypothetical protein